MIGPLETKIEYSIINSIPVDIAESILGHIGIHVRVILPSWAKFDFI